MKIKRRIVFPEAFFLLVLFVLACVVFPLTASASESTLGQLQNSWRYKNGRPAETLENSFSLQSPFVLQSKNVIARGVDVSEWQGDIDWQAVKNSGQVDFAIIRVGFSGTNHDRADNKWERNASECERLGIPYGVYVYSYASDWNALNGLVSNTRNWIGNHTPAYPVFIDMEDSSTVGCGRDTLTSFAKSFCDQIQNAGFVAGVYANTNWFNNILYGDQLNSYVKWVAQYNSTCTYSGEYAMWQYSSSGHVSGISGNVDVNYLYKEIAVSESRFKGVYDYDFYLEANEDVARAFGGNRFRTLVHFICNGMREGRLASVLFDPNYYKSQYEDLSKAFGSDNVSYYNHFLEYGMKEGRNASDMFIFSYYKENNADLSKAFGDDKQRYYYHFLENGMKEGRKASSSFSLESYFNRYSDLRVAFRSNLKNYYIHYSIHGKKEGRQTLNCSSLQSPVVAKSGINYSSVYDVNYYVDNYADLKNAYGKLSDHCSLIDDTGLLEHFIEYGMKEGRRASVSFNLEDYYNRYQDLRVAFRGNLKNYYMHYVTYGQKEGRQALNCPTLQSPVSAYRGVYYSLVYDGNYYVNNNADLKNAYGKLSDHCSLIDDTGLLEHFIEYGMKEARQAKSTFNVKSYYNEYPDLRAAFGNNWKNYYIHYIQYGNKEGRNTTGCNALKG